MAAWVGIGVGAWAVCVLLAVSFFHGAYAYAGAACPNCLTDTDEEGFCSGCGRVVRP